MRDLTAPRVLELVNRVDRAATREVVSWLERDEPLPGRPPRRLVDLGKLVDRLPASTVVTAHLMWRGTAIELFQAEVDLGRNEASLVERAKVSLGERCDAALAAVSQASDDAETLLADPRALLTSV
jgi:hypothetical protein